MRSTMSLPSLRRQCIVASAALLAFAPSGTNGSASNPATTRVAVVGGGIAGSMTVLELLERGFQDVTLLERNPDLLQSTSSMIAVRPCARVSRGIVTELYFLDSFKERLYR